MNRDEIYANIKVIFNSGKNAMEAALLSDNRLLNQEKCEEAIRNIVAEYDRLTDENTRLTKEWHGARCILMEQHGVFKKYQQYMGADFSKTLAAIENYLSGLDPYSGVYEENEALKQEVSRLREMLGEKND